MKICHITTVHNLFDTRIFYKECLSLHEENYEVYLIAVNDSFLQNEVLGIKLINLNKPKNRIDRMIRINLMAFIHAIKLKAKVYHFHDPEFIIFAFLLKLINRCKVIYDIHENYSEEILIKDWIPSKFLRKIISKSFDFIERILVKKFDALILAEEVYYKRFQNLNEKVIFIFNYPLLNNLNISFKKFNKNKDHFNLIYSGFISEDRGIWNILKSFKILLEKRKDVKLFLVGYFTNLNLLKKVKHYLIDNKIDKFVILIGGDKFIKREKIDRIYKFMDLGLVVFPYIKYYYEKLPTKFFEYMMFEIPIIASNYFRWKEFLEKNECGIAVNPDNYYEIAEKIDKILSDINLLKRMGSNGKSLVLEKYNWNIEKEKLISLYKELLR